MSPLEPDVEPGRTSAPATVDGTLETHPEADPNRMRLEEREAGVVLLSGGIDSATTLAVAQSQGQECYALTVDYGQRHAVEVERARSLALYLGAPHRTVRVDLRAFGGSALTDAIDVPRPESSAEIGRSIPATYVPGRNTILLSLALAWGEVLHARNLYIGANVLDYSGYPDCRPEYLRAFERMANLGTRAGVEGTRPFRVHAPLLRMTKAEIIQQGAMLGVPFQLTHSCYDPDDQDRACGLCDACILRRRGFADADIEDPTPYAS